MRGGNFIDATRFGVRPDDVGDNYIGAQSFLALFGNVGHLVNVGYDRSRLMDSVSQAIYGVTSGEEYNFKLEIDVERAKRGEPVYCEGAREIIFPGASSEAAPRRMPVQYPLFGT